MKRILYPIRRRKRVRRLLGPLPRCRYAIYGHESSRCEREQGHRGLHRHGKSGFPDLGRHAWDVPQ